MSTNPLICLHQPTSLLEISAHSQQVAHLLICSSSEQACNQVSACLATNRSQGVVGGTVDNIGRIQIGGFGVIGPHVEELAKLEALKKLLELMEVEGRNKVGLGIYYYVNYTGHIRFYRILDQKDCQNHNDFNIMSAFGFFAYLLCYSVDIKEYILKWRQVALKKEKFNPTLKNKNKIDHFITAILNKQIPTTKIAYHTLQLAMEKVKWVSNVPHQQAKLTEGESTYSDVNMKINLGNKNQPPRRLKQSTSMTNLSSTSKGRKYHKGPPQKIFKENCMKTCKSFWTKGMGSTMMDKNFSTTTNAFKANNKSTNSNWLKQSALLESFARINQSNLERDFINQTDLLELLENREKNRKINCQKEANDSNKAHTKSIIADKIQNARLEVNFIQRPRKQLTFFYHNIDIQIRPVPKFTKLTKNSTVYSFNQNFPKSQSIENKQLAQIGLLKCEGKVFQQGIPQDKVTVTKNKMTTQERLETLQQQQKNQILKNWPQTEIKIEKTIFEINANFVFTTIQKMCQDTSLRCYFLVTLYAIYIYAYTALSRGQNQQSRNSSETALIKIVTKLQQIKAEPSKNPISHTYLFLGMNQQNIRDIDELLERPISTGTQTDKLKQTCLRVIKKQFEKHRQCLPRQYQNLIKNNKYKRFLIFLMRSAISTSIINDPFTENCAVNDFSRYQKKIQDARTDRQIRQIDLRAELRNVQSLI